LNLRPSGYEFELRLYTGSCPTGPSEHGDGRLRACQHRFRSVRFVRYSARELWSPPVPVSQCVIHDAFLKWIVGRWQAIVISSRSRISVTRSVLSTSVSRQAQPRRPQIVPRDFELGPGSIPVGAIAETGTAWGAPAAGEPAILFLPAITARQL